LAVAGEIVIGHLGKGKQSFEKIKVKKERKFVENRKVNFFPNDHFLISRSLFDIKNK